MIFIILSIFFIVSIFALFPLKSKAKERNSYILFGVILVAIAGFRGDSVDFDYKTYLSMYDRVTDGVAILTEPTFVLIAKFAHILGGPLILFILYAIIGVSLKLVAIRNLTELWFLSLLIYLSNYFILHEVTQIRVGVAAGLLLLCIKPIYERNWKLFLLLSITAFFFHGSAIIIFPLWVLGYKKPHKLLLALSIPIAYLIYFSKINLIGIIPIPGIQEKIMLYQVLQEQEAEGVMGINVFNKIFILKTLIFYFLLWKYEIIIQYNKYAVIFMKIFCISLFSFPVFAIMPVMGFRISELFGVVEIVLFPLIYYVFKQQFFSRLLVILLGFMVLLISIFYNKLMQ